MATSWPVRFGQPSLCGLDGKMGDTGGAEISHQEIEFAEQAHLVERWMAAGIAISAVLCLVCPWALCRFL